jgi:hypothetical protein
MTSGVIRKAITRGIQEGHFAYATGPKPALTPEGKFEVALAKIRFMVPVAEDEIDLESGFLMVPQSIPQATATVETGPTTTSEQERGSTQGGIGTGGTGIGTGGFSITGGNTQTGSGSAVKPELQKLVEVNFATDRNGLFAAWNAVANLADMAGSVAVSIRAESDKGFDKAKLQNGVLEPLREADLIE